MRILLLANNWVGWQVADWLLKKNENLVGAVLHPPERQRYGNELTALMAGHAVPVFFGSQLQSSDVIGTLGELDADLAVSIYFGYILKPSFISLFTKGVINLHPALLPYNKGAHPNVWSIVERTPAGVTLHYIDSGVDTGDILAQAPVAVEPIDTAKTLYHKLERASLKLFQSAWPSIKADKTVRTSQSKDVGTHHRTKDLEGLDCIDLEHLYTARELIDQLRARTFPPYPGAYFVVDGRKVHIRLALSYSEEANT